MCTESFQMAEGKEVLITDLAPAPLLGLGSCAQRDFPGVTADTAQSMLS